MKQVSLTKHKRGLDALLCT